MRIISALRVGGASVLSIGGLLIGSAGVALAAPSTVYVAKANCSDSGPGTHQKPYCTIQKGVNNVAPGGTINIYDGATYSEQVVINNKDDLTINGAGSTLKMPTAPTTGGSILAIKQSTGLKVKNLNVMGPFTVNSCATEEYGINIQNKSAVSLANVTVSDVRPADDSFFGCQQGVGIFVNTDSSATMRAVTVSRYAKDGIEVNGNKASATIQQSTVTGTPTPLTALNGIQISRGATATLKQNTVTGNEYTIPDAQNPVGYTASGILIYQAGAVTANQNQLSSNDVAFDIEGSNDGSYAQNVVNNNTTNGFFVASDAKNNSFLRNSIQATSGSVHYTPYDVEDDSTGTKTAHTANTYEHNSCSTSLPAAICQV